ncbi:MAG: NHL repeat-containing protein [Candidatus Sumerlaeota bacterium]|nr:NHL repeat-containing protein [Candidatus Sumerlaeota bacterium]
MAQQKPLPFAFRQTAVVNSGMKTPRGIAIDAQDRLYIAGREGLRVFDSKGVSIAEAKTSRPARCVAVAEDGFIYVGEDIQIEKFQIARGQGSGVGGQGAGAGDQGSGANAEGQSAIRNPQSAIAGPQSSIVNRQSSILRVGAWGKEGHNAGEFGFITSLAISNYYLYVADAGNRRISRFTVGGDVIDDIGPFVVPSPYFDCAVDTTGTLYVGHSGELRVERFNQNGKRIGVWGEGGEAPEKFSGCCNPTNLAVFPDGRVATSEKGIPRVKIHDATGRLLACLDSKAFSPDVAGLALAIDSKGRLAVLDPGTAKITYYEIIRNTEK